jgi:murein DD-endopeptidase MepM/ murein hydrolase activator NlpD
MFRDYAVQKHDHVDAIARDLGTTRKIVVDANHLKAPFTLQPGQHLKVPVARAYVAQSGDTLAQVARRFGLGADELALLNDLSERSRLRAGERLALPADFHDHGATRSKPTYVTEYVEEPPRQTPYRAGPARIATTVPPSTTSKPSPSPPYAPPRTSTSPAQAYAPPATHPYAPPPVRPTVQAYVPARPTVQAYEPPPPRVSSASETTESLPADVAALGRGRFIWPVRGEIISPFGVKGLGRRNDGVDIRARQGTVILAAAGGNVVYAGDQVPGFGNLVLVKHSDGWVTAYAHLDKISVQMRQNINQGQEIGQVGETGGAAEPELHFEVRYAATPTDRAKPVDPMVVLPR